MIKSLSILNVAIIDKLNIEFCEGMNVLTGETGAGKSIIFDSLNFLLGDRADKNLIRYGQNIAKVSGIFFIDQNIDKIKSVFNKYDLQYLDEIMISRTMTLDGKNEIRLNGEIITLSILKEISQYMVDIYGQNDHQFLLKQKNHLSFLDAFGQKDIEPIKNKYDEIYHQIKSFDKKLDDMGGSDDERMREIDFLQYQINELDNAHLSIDEENELIEEKRKLMNIEKIVDSTSKIQQNLEQYILPAMSEAYSEITSASKFDSTLEEMKERFNSLKIDASTLFDDIYDYNNSTQFDEAHFNEIDTRLDLYNSLKRKYNATIEQILQKHNELKERYNLLINFTEERRKLVSQKQVLQKNALEVAILLHNARQKNASTIEQLIKNELKDLGMKNADIRFEFLNYLEEVENLTSHGLDDLEIEFSANLGEPLKPLIKIISGGEMSRLMLAIKTVAVKYDSMPTMIFDEIESGVSGDMAQAIAKKMAKIASNHQLIAITHSQHIASMADCHFLIKKEEADNKTTSSIIKLSDEERIDEIARFVSTDNTFEVGRQNAIALLNAQSEYKKSL